MKRLILDVSNIARSKDFPAPLGCSCRGEKAHLGNLLAIIHAIESDLGEGINVTAIADSSLRAHLCTPEEQRYFDGLVRDGLLTRTRYADPVILEKAVQSPTSLVVSNDLFRAFRRSHDSLFGANRFVRWRVSQGAVELKREDVNVWPGDVTRSIESDEVGAERETAAALAWLSSRRWRCPNPSCTVGQAFPDEIPVLPVVTMGAVLCRWCRRPLDDIGRGVPSVPMVLENGMTQGLRFRLDEGASVVIGRGGDRVLCISDDPQISRRHIEVRLRGNEVEVRDLHSTNGSTVNRWDSRTGRENAAGQLSTAWTPLRQRERVRMGRTQNTLRLSGAHWILTLPAAEGLPQRGARNVGKTLPIGDPN